MKNKHSNKQMNKKQQLFYTLTNVFTTWKY